MGVILILEIIQQGYYINKIHKKKINKLKATYEQIQILNTVRIIANNNKTTWIICSHTFPSEFFQSANLYGRAPENS